MLNVSQTPCVSCSEIGIAEDAEEIEEGKKAKEDD
jgi:hypothetical protein